LKRPLRGSKRFENTGLTRLPVIQKKDKKSCDSTGPALSGLVPDAIQTIAASSGNGERVIESLAK